MKFFFKFTVKIDKIRLFKNNGRFSELHLQDFEILVKCVELKNFNGIFLQYF